ncbi:Optineurin [Manis javanica]|nr:Optineurin [Manis javanica]
MFMTVVLKNPLRTKQLQQGLMQLGEEGAIQVFKPEAGGNMLLGAVGQLQLKSSSTAWESRIRLRHPPGRLPVHRRTLDHGRHPGRTARIRERLPAAHGRDAADTLAYLCTSPYDVRLAQERFPKIHFHRCASMRGWRCKNIREIRRQDSRHQKDHYLPTIEYCIDHGTGSSDSGDYKKRHILQRLVYWNRIPLPSHNYDTLSHYMVLDMLWRMRFSLTPAPDASNSCKKVNISLTNAHQRTLHRGEQPDPRVRVLYNPENRGVGGAIVTAYKAAIADGMDIGVKIDGDGQMDPRCCRCSCTKLSCGYWNVMDPTNGYTAVRTCVLAELPLDKLESRYFFETDMLFRLNTVRAVVKDVPMDSVYADEESNSG